MTLITPVTPRAARAPGLWWRGRAAGGAGRRPQRPLPLRAWLLPGLGLGAGLGCAGDHLTREPPRPPAALYWELALNHHAVTLSLLPPYDTLTLLAAPRNALGEPLDALGTPEYRSTDLDRVQVTPEGVLHAVGLTADGQPVVVVATLTADNLKYVDTVLVRVVADTLPKLASLSIHPVPPDSAKIPMGGLTLLTPLPIRAVDGHDSLISDLLFAARSSDPSTVRVVNYEGTGRLVVQGWRLGVATVVASATVFGVTKADTVPYRVGWPIKADIELSRLLASGVIVFDSSEARVGVGAVVGWRRSSDDIVDVTFADADTAQRT